MSTAKKVMVIGLDAIIARQVYRYAQDGHMPRVKRLLDTGVFANNCLPPFPGITPPNWSTLATGATAVTHNITCFNVHVPGDGRTGTRARRRVASAGSPAQPRLEGRSKCRARRPSTATTPAVSGRGLP